MFRIFIFRTLEKELTKTRLKEAKKFSTVS